MQEAGEVGGEGGAGGAGGRRKSSTSMATFLTQFLLWSLTANFASFLIMLVANPQLARLALRISVQARWRGLLKSYLGWTVRRLSLWEKEVSLDRQPSQTV